MRGVWHSLMRGSDAVIVAGLAFAGPALSAEGPADANESAAVAPEAPAVPAGPATPEPGLSVGTAVPNFMLPVVHGADAKRFGPAKWTGPGAESPKQLVLMSFFATWCEPCKKEMPELVRLSTTYADAGLGILLVSIDKGLDQRDAVVQLAASQGVNFPVLHDRFQVVARRYQAERLPYLLLVGADGVVKHSHVGYAEGDASWLEQEVRAELGLTPLEEPAPKAAKKGKSKKRRTRSRRTRSGGR